MWLWPAVPHLIADWRHNVLNLILGEEVRNLPWGQEVVDEDQKLLVGDVSVGHEEHRTQVLEASTKVQVGKVTLRER